MNQSKVVLRFLLPTDQDTPEAIHPTVRSFRDPAACFEAHLMLDRLSFFAPRANMSGIGKFLHQRSDLTGIISLIQAHPLGPRPCRPRAGYRDTRKRRLDHFTVMTIGSGNRHANRDTVGFRQQTAFNAFLGPICRVGAGFFPRPAGPWSWPHPSTAKTNQSLSTRHSLPEPGPRVSERLRRASIPEIANEPCCSSKCLSRSKRSIGSRFATQRGCHPGPGGPGLAAGPRRNDAYWDASVAAARSFPTVRPKSCICFSFSVLSFLNPFRGTVASEYIGYPRVIRIGS